MSNGMLALLAGMGGGYLRQKQQNVENERQEKMDKIAIDKADRETADWEKKQREQLALATAGKAADVNTDAATLDTGDGARTYAMANAPDVASSDARQFSRMQDATIAPNAQPARPIIKTGMQTVNGQVMSDHAQVMQAAAAYDSPEAKTKRLAQAYDSIGQPEKAMQLQSAAQQLKLGGLKLSEAEIKHADNVFNANVNSAITDAGGNIPVALAKVMTDSKITGDAKYTVNIGPDGKSGAIMRMGADGIDTSVMPFTNDAMGHAALLANIARLPLETKIRFVFEQHKAESKDAKNKADAEYKTGMLGVSQQNANTQEQYRKDQSAIGMERATQAGTPKTAPIWDAKADEHLYKMFTSKNPDTGEAMVDAGGLQFGKAVAFGRAGQNGGDTLSSVAFAKEVDDKLKTASKGDLKALSVLRQQYLKTVQSTPATGSSTRVSQADQQSRDGDAISILQSELKSTQAKADAGDARAKADLPYIQREIDAKQKRTPVTASMEKAVSPGQAKTDTPQRSTASMADAPKPKQTDPLTGKGQQAIREIKADLTKERARWAAKPNAEGRVAEIDVLLNRIEKGQY